MVSRICRLLSPNAEISTCQEALDHLNEDATTDEIDEEIQNELEAWCD
jgi:hypothetical protein